MPAITIYIKQSDVELVKEAKTKLSESLSSIFAEALKKKLCQRKK